MGISTGGYETISKGECQRAWYTLSNQILRGKDFKKIGDLKL